MSDDYAQSLQKYWKWIHERSPDVQRVVLECWDETGRPKYDHVQPVVMLLDTCDTWDEFYTKYKELMSGFEQDEYKITEDAAMYWKIYIAGLYQMAKD